MRWSWKLGTFAGIGVYVHATFLLLIGWVVMTEIGRSGLAGVVYNVVFVITLFVCVVLHEYGHALTARRYGIRTQDITLYPIGGVARLERMPEDPNQELLVAAAGPAVNVVIAGALFGWLFLTGGLSSEPAYALVAGGFAERLMYVNLFIVGFNLLPAFPMDGGRMVRALLAKRMEYVRATQIAATLGQGMAFLFGFLGLFTNPFLLFIALFVWIGAAQESSMVQIKAGLGGIPVNRAMITHFRVLSAGDPLSSAVQLILTGSQEDFPVVEDGALVGVLTKTDMLKALASDGQNAPVEAVMRRDFQIANGYESLDQAFGRLQASQCPTMPVVARGQLIGLLTPANVTEFLLIRNALASRPKAGGKMDVTAPGQPAQPLAPEPRKAPWY